MALLLIWLRQLLLLALLQALLQALLALLQGLLVPLQAPLPSSPLPMLLLPHAQAQVQRECCCARQLLHCLLQLHWHLQQLCCRLPRASLCLQQPALQTQQLLLLLLALPRCALLGLQSCS